MRHPAISLEGLDGFRFKRCVEGSRPILPVRVNPANEFNRRVTILEEIRRAVLKRAGFASILRSPRRPVILPTWWLVQEKSVQRLVGACRRAHQLDDRSIDFFCG